MSQKLELSITLFETPCRLELEPMVLNMAQAFGTSHSKTTQRTNALVAVTIDAITGYGESGLPPKKPGIYMAGVRMGQSIPTWHWGLILLVQIPCLSMLQLLHLTLFVAIPHNLHCGFCRRRLCRHSRILCRMAGPAECCPVGSRRPRPGRRVRPLRCPRPAVLPGRPGEWLCPRSEPREGCEV
jgi:hypothetical protein